MAESQITEHHAPGGAPYATRLARNRLGLWLFVFSDAFVFVGLFIARLVLLGEHRPELLQGLGLGVTAMLLVSSFFMNRAEVEMAHGNRPAFLRNIMVTLVLGAIFLVGVVGVEWQLAPFGPADGAQGAVFYSMTGFHAFHVFTGLVLLFIVWNNGRRGLYTKEEHWGVEAAAIYWHFVDVVWMFFYVGLYLMGTAI
jgi:cytochrome c oxidase subunit 3